MYFCIYKVQSYGQFGLASLQLLNELKRSIQMDTFATEPQVAERGGLLSLVWAKNSG